MLMFSDPAANLARLGLTDGMKVADLGAGSGFYSIEAARQVGSTGRVYAVDLQKPLLERLRAFGTRQGLGNIEVIAGDVEKIGGTKLREDIADRVIASNVLFQLGKPGDCVLEIKRLLKPGGKVLVVYWSELSPIAPKTLIPADKTQTLFEQNGFVLDQAFRAGDHHYGLVMAKKSL